MANYPPMRKDDGVWREVLPFHRKAEGWTVTRAIYKKVAGAWVQIYGSTTTGGSPVPKPAGTVKATTTVAGKIIGTCASVSGSPEKVVLHIGVTQPKTTPTSIADKYKSGTDFYRVYKTPTGPVTIEIDGIKDNTTYYVTMWAQDAGGAWSKLSACKLKTRAAKKVIASYTDSEVKVLPTWAGTYYHLPYPLFTKSLTTFTIANLTPGVTGRRGVWMFGSELMKATQGKIVKSVEIELNRYKDNRSNGKFFMGVHENGWPTGSFMNGALYTGTIFQIPPGKKRIPVRAAAYPDFQSGKLKSISVNLDGTDGTGGFGNAFYAAATLYVKIQTPVYKSEHPVVASTAV